MKRHETVLRVIGMDCADEVAILEKTLNAVDGIRDVRANLMASKITVTHDARVTAQTLRDAIAPTGMKATLPGAKPEREIASGQRVRLIAVALSAILTGIGLAFQWTGIVPEAVRAVVFGAAVVSGGWFIFPKAVAAARRFSPDMNLLMTMAVVGAACIGEWSEAAAVTFLFGLSELLEAFSVQRARRAIESLMELSPETALLKRDGEFKEVSVEQVKIGEVFAIKSGARVPLDGEVINGASAVNQAPITGESMPVEKKAGDEVFAGTINGEGSLEVRVTKASSETMLARIINLV
jgi:Cd2+/Zn2+-exporting ATPase